MTELIHFWIDLAIVNEKYSRRNQLFPGAEQEANHFPSSFKDGLYLRFQVEV